MGLKSFAVRDFRNIAAAELEFSPRLNLISGANGAGKTSLLEALYFLGRAQSFRTHHPATLIRTGAESFIVRGSVQSQDGELIPVGIQRSKAGINVRMGGKPVRLLTDLIEKIPFQLLNPDSHRLLEGGPRFRRRYLDWGVFHVEPGFFPTWQRYSRALKQRNAALRARLSPQEIRLWDEELVATAAVLHDQRCSYLEKLLPALSLYIGKMVDITGLDWMYQPGWAAATSFEQALVDGLERDKRRGFTRVGPHRADLYPTLDGQVAQERVSRGQQKQIVAAMMLAQAAVYQQERGRASLFLVDDLPSELDVDHRNRVMSQLEALGGQVFVTAIDPSAIGMSAWRDHKAFHVEHGRIEEVVY